jgi:mono/diheme cytochrome c family protein
LRVAFAIVSVLASAALAQSPADNYAGASRVPKARSGWERFSMKVEQDAPFDEAQGDITAAGTPISKRNEACFPTDERNLFWEVDQLRGLDGNLHPFNFSEGGKISAEARKAIRGQNTWMLWSEGDEAFWGWLFQERNYGITDFLVLIDSRNRAKRFKDAGLVNQPGMKAQTDSAKKILGLYLDQADGRRILLTQPEYVVNGRPDDTDSRTGKLAARRAPPPEHPTDLFKPADPNSYRDTMRKLATDGVDPDIYGYPSGVIGLRLFPNPDFFAETDAAKQARADWKTKVEDLADDDPKNYYRNPDTASDPTLVRPFRVSMTCAFCHVGPHPLNPPAKPEEPQWENLSSLIGAQYWDGPRTFSNLKKADSFLYQIVASWQPGTLDTSLVITDQINNPVTMNAIFGIPARVDRAKLNPAEAQSPANLKVPGVEEPPLFANARHTPRVLLDGSDSIGLSGALARVYLNVGAYSEQWRRLHNPIIGLRAQRPFEIATLEGKSAYWRTTMAERIPELVAFLTYANRTGETFTAPMKLASMKPEGEKEIADEIDAAAKGRAVFLRNCAICHSSKQPDGFALTFSRNWAAQSTPAAGQPAHFVLPMDFADWEAFKLSDAYREYVKRIEGFARPGSTGSDPFLENNYLSTDIRVPVTLVGTNSSRAVGTNAMRGQIWDNFSSETYKNLPAVGAVHFYNPYSGEPADDWGNNDVYYPPAGGPGYYRPATLIGVWATAPFLHNNALGRYTQDPSMKGRLTAFNDAADKLLWKAHRPLIDKDSRRPGDLRDNASLAGHDPGFIYRTTARSWIDFPPKFIRVVLVGAMGEGLTSFLTYYLWLGLGAVAIVLVCVGRQQDAGFVLLLFGILDGVVLRMTRIDTIYPSLWWIVGADTAGALLLWLAPKSRLVAQLFFAVLACGFFLVGAVVHDWVGGLYGPLKIGPIPQGTPVNLLQSLNPQAPARDLVDALSGLTRGLLRIRKDNLSDVNGAALHAFEGEAGLALLKASKCPDFVLDRGHWFAEGLTQDEKQQLKAFLKTL